MDFVSFSLWPQKDWNSALDSQLDCPAGLLPGLQLNMLSLYCQEIWFSPIEKNKTTTTKTVAEGNMSSHYKDKARPNTRKAAKPFKLTYQNMVINGVIYNQSVNWLKNLVISIKATWFKTNPPNQNRNEQQKCNWSSILKLVYEVIYEHCCLSEAACKELLSSTFLALTDNYS